MVDDDKLKISVELLERSVHDRIKREIEILTTSMTLKIKKRLKMKDIISKFSTKVDSVEFNKQLERINNNVTVFSDKVEFRLPAMELDFNRRISNKADIESVNKALNTKVDKEFLDTIFERMNGMEEKIRKVEELAIAGELGDMDAGGQDE
tara:strand:- start:408 stop:860 length:453 start_codon:yes stop_codon:yes gene_type:complete